MNRLSVLKFSQRCSSTRPIRVGVYSSSSCITNDYYRSFSSSTVSPSATPPSSPSSASSISSLHLFQYYTCPFCTKVRCLLDYHALPYGVIEINPSQIKKSLFFSDYKKVPILFINGNQTNDSTAIYQAISNIVKPTDSGSIDKMKSFEDRLIPLISVNMYRSLSDSFASMSYITQFSNFSYFSKLVSQTAGAIVMRIIGKKRAKQLNVKAGEERYRLTKFLNEFLSEYQQKIAEAKPLLTDHELVSQVTQTPSSYDINKQYNPDIVEVAIFGMIRALFNASIATRNDLINHAKKYGLNESSLDWILLMNQRLHVSYAKAIDYKDALTQLGLKKNK